MRKDSVCIEKSQVKANLTKNNNKQKIHTTNQILNLLYYQN